MWGQYVDYGRHAVEYICAMSQAHLFRAYVSNVKHVYRSASGDTVCIKFI